VSENILEYTLSGCLDVAECCHAPVVFMISVERMMRKEPRVCWFAWHLEA